MAPGETHTARFVAQTPGTWYYWGRADYGPYVDPLGSGRDAALAGAFIADSANVKVDLA